jgi:hypothetical protein
MREIMSSPNIPSAILSLGGEDLRVIGELKIRYLNSKEKLMIM